MKLQEAFASEKTALGSFAAIGYKTPGAGNGDSTTVFKYGGQAGSSVVGKWDAETRVGLNDCAKGKKWLVQAAYASTSGNVTFKVGSDDTANCITPLTPNFCNLATKGSCEITAFE